MKKKRTGKSLQKQHCKAFTFGVKLKLRFVAFVRVSEGSVLSKTASRPGFFK